MTLTKQILVLIALLLMLSATSCSKQNVKSKNAAPSIRAGHSEKISGPSQPDYSADLETEAQKYKSSPGRVALAMIICKLENSYSYSDIVKYSAKELFDILSESAVANNITLESLNTRYGLLDILASEKIYVSITANNVTYLSPSSSKNASTDSTASTTWISNFHKVISTN